MIMNQTFAQTCKAKIVDEDTKQPIRGASVSLISQNEGGKIQESATDETGFVSLVLEKEVFYQLKISMIGYEVVSRVISLVVQGDDDTSEFTLKRITHYLGDVDVFQNGKKKFIELKDGQIILNVSSSPLETGGNAYGTLLRAPGVFETNGNLYFRTKSLNVLIDGRPTTMNGEELKNYLNAIPSSLVNRIEIMPNPSAKYDSEGGSVVNIILLKNSAFGLNGNVWGNIGTGEKVRHNEGVQLNYGSGNFTTYVSYDYSGNHQFYKSMSTIRQSALQLEQDNHELRKRSIHTFRLGADFNLTNTITIGGQFRTFDNLGNRSASNDALGLTHSGDVEEVFSSTTSDVHISNPYVNLYANFQLDSLGRSISVNADYFRQRRRWNDNITIKSRDDFRSQLLRGNQPIKVALNSVSVDLNYPLLVGKIEAGLKGQQSKSYNDPYWEKKAIQQDDNWEVDSVRTYDFRFTEDIYNAYLNWNTSMGAYLTGVFGVRGEYIRLNGELIEASDNKRRTLFYVFPSVGLSYQKTPDHVWSYNYRMNIDRFGFNVVNPFEMYINPYYSSIGNPDIKPQIP